MELRFIYHSTGNVGQKTRLKPDDIVYYDKSSKTITFSRPNNALKKKRRGTILYFYTSQYGKGEKAFLDDKYFLGAMDFTEVIILISAITGLDFERINDFPDAYRFKV